MNLDSSGNKSTTENLYKIAFGDSVESKSNTQDIVYASNSAKPSQSIAGDVYLDFNKIDITEDFNKFLLFLRPCRRNNSIRV